MNKTLHRVEWIDIAKGIGIFLVVVVDILDKDKVRILKKEF